MSIEATLSIYRRSPLGRSRWTAVISALSNRGAQAIATGAASMAVGALLLWAGDAGAAPLAGAKSIAVESRTILVRDGCGRGMRFSNRRQTCVEDFDAGPPPRVIEERRDFRGGPSECDRGMRFSNSRQRCVWIDGGHRDDGNGVAAAAATVLGVVGAASASSNRDKGQDRPQGQSGRVNRP